MSTAIHRQVVHLADMGRKRPPQTVDSASGPDHGDTFPWHHRVSEATETSSVDLMEAKEKQQHAEDKEFIERYYNQQPSKRKRYNENKKERLWRAEERLAMSAEDINIQELNNTVDQKLKKKTMSLSSSLLSLAKTLDKKVDDNQHGAPDSTSQHQVDGARGLSNSRRFRIQTETTAECAYGTEPTFFPYRRTFGCSWPMAWTDDWQVLPESKDLSPLKTLAAAW